MKTFYPLFLLLFLAACQQTALHEDPLGPEVPDDYLYRQRAYPHNELDYEAYRAGMQQLQAQQLTPRSGLNWELLGPTNIGGRVTAIAFSPINTNRYYVGTSSGGVFRSTDAGESWQPIFDGVGSPSIGAIAAAPDNQNVLYVGTGTANGSGNSGAFFGDGIYKSEDGGNTWQHLGLEATQQIGRIVIDPNNTNRIYVAALGGLYSEDQHRGLYSSEDGGETWERIFFLDESTSCADVIVNPSNPNVLYVVAWERLRRVNQVDFAGSNSGIYLSTNRGGSWEKLEDGLPNLGATTGRISLAMAPSDPKVLYASYTFGARFNEFQGLYKSVNNGQSWAPIGLSSIPLNIYGTFGWFFGNITVDPTNPDGVHVLGINLHRSIDGGATWLTNREMHVDHHAMAYHPLNPNLVLIGNDGGVYRSVDAGGSWGKLDELPITQFYTNSYDPQQPARFYGGTQDNGTLRTLTGEENDWEEILGGDGFHVAVDPTDQNYIYAEMQGGRFFRSTDGGQLFTRAEQGIDDNDRFNFNTPFLIDPTEPQTLYIGSQRLYRSTDRAALWEPISSDLTRGPQPAGSLANGTITCIAVSPNNADHIFVGTDDGLVQRSLDGGTNWTRVSDGLPNRHVTALAFDPLNESRIYVTFSGYRYEDYLPHVFRSEDQGSSWNDISGNLPEVPINDIVINPIIENQYFVATDLGVWYTSDDGGFWEVLGENLPPTAVTDLTYMEEEDQLLAATFGRSMHQFDLGLLISTEPERPRPPLQMTVLPNPVRDQFRLQLELPQGLEGQLELYDLMGRMVLRLGERRFPAGEHLETYRLPELPAGTYVLRLRSDVGSHSCQVVLL
ncbi:MAG: T9SS type A sorting domain-containing protein [Bacteroidota bacterium]